MRTVNWIFLGLTLTASLPAYSLGFGELSVSSGLGQVLHGYIRLLDVPKDISPDCFKLRPIENSGLPLPPSIRLEIERTPDKQARLKLSSSQPIDEPVLMFAARADCGIQLGREYTLLLDPIPAHEPLVEAMPAATLAQPETIAPAKIPAPSSTQAERQQATAAPVTAAMHAPRKPPKNKSNSRQKIVQKNRLVISHGSSSSSVKAGKPLAQDTSVMTLNDLADENASLNLKLAHLEQQLNALQKRHAEFVARQEIKAAAKPKDTPSFTWAHILPGLLPLAFAAAWLLHRQNKRTLRQSEETGGNIQHIRRSPATPPSSDVGLESLPATQEEAPQAHVDTELPEHAPGKPEIHDGLEDNVEVFIAHGQNALAIRLLEEHLFKDPKGSLAPWLLWLDLLHRAENPEKYEEVRLLCRWHFNVIVPTYETYQDYAPATGVESYRHVMAELIRLWPTNKIAGYLDDLLYDNRRGNRIGFDAGAYHEIMLLRAICGIPSVL